MNDGNVYTVGITYLTDIEETFDAIYWKLSESTIEIDTEDAYHVVPMKNVRRVRIVEKESDADVS